MDENSITINDYGKEGERKLQSKKMRHLTIGKKISKMESAGTSINAMHKIKWKKMPISRIKYVIRESTGTPENTAHQTQRKIMSIKNPPQETSRNITRVSEVTNRVKLN